MLLSLTDEETGCKEAELKSACSGKGRRHTEWTGDLRLASKLSGALGVKGC